jgi:hypothetical protein
MKISWEITVDCKIFSEHLKRRFECKTRRDLDGYWHPFIMEGQGRMGRLCPGDVVKSVRENKSDIVARVGLVEEVAKRRTIAPSLSMG